jgi:hypothetical protein
MKTHQFKTNQLGVTYSEFGQNLFYQLNQAYAKLNGKNPSASNPKKGYKHRNNQTINS